MATKKHMLWILLILGVAFTGALIASTIKTGALDFKVKPWFLNADGQWVSIILPGNRSEKIEFSTPDAEIIELPYWAYDDRSAVRVITETAKPVTLTARSSAGTKTIVLPSPADIYKQRLHMTLTPVGPHLVTIGFTWLGDPNAIQQFQIWRSEDSARESMIGYVTTNTKTYQDTSVKPNTTYQYTLKAMGNNEIVSSVSLKVTTLSPLKPKSLANITGKGMFIYIDPDNESSRFYYKKLLPTHIISDAKKLGLRYIQLRTVYGAYTHFNHPGLIVWLTELLDLGAQNNLAVISWSVPRFSLTEGVAEDVKMASLTTPAGNSFAGSAVDLEPGPDYMGKLAEAKPKMVHYIETYRKAVGPDYLISAVVFTPWVTGFTNEIYPYDQLAAHADVMQPMEFWHHFYIASGHQYTTNEVIQAVTNSIVLLKKLSMRDIPINVIGQLVDIGDTGAPSAQEISTALQAAKDNSAIGMSFFAWFETVIHEGDRLSPQAQAIADFKW